MIICDVCKTDAPGTKRRYIVVAEMGHLFPTLIKDKGLDLCDSCRKRVHDALPSFIKSLKEGLAKGA